MRVTAKRKTGGEVSAEFDFGENLEQAVAKFGDNTVYKNYLAAMKVAFQGWLRGQLDAGKTQEEIDQAATSWTPGDRAPGKSPAEKLRAILDAMSAEDRKAFLKEFAASKAA